MGTPEDKDRYGVRKVLSILNIAQKLRLLEIGKQTGQKLEFDNLPVILEEVKEVLMPLVEWMDHPIYPRAETENCPVPEKFKKRRGMHLLDCYIMDIWLQRSGKWLLRFRSLDHPGEAFREVNSPQLASILLEKADDFLGLFLGNPTAKMLEEFSFLKDCAFYHVMFPGLVFKLLEPARNLVKHREERLRAIKERLDLLEDFAQALDPITSQVRKITIGEYSIYDSSGRGIRNCATTYFCSSALEPFWEMLKKRGADLSEYQKNKMNFSIKSLESLLERVSYKFSEMENTRRKVKEITPEYAFNCGRLPFTDKEVAVLKELVASITVVE